MVGYAGEQPSWITNYATRRRVMRIFLESVKSAADDNPQVVVVFANIDELAMSLGFANKKEMWKKYGTISEAAFGTWRLK